MPVKSQAINKNMLDGKHTVPGCMQLLVRLQLHHTLTLSGV